MADTKRDFFDPEKLNKLWVPKEGDLNAPVQDFGPLPSEPLKLWQLFLPSFEGQFGTTQKKICDNLLQEIQTLLEQMFPMEERGEEGEIIEKVPLDEKELAGKKNTLKELFNQLEDMMDAFFMMGPK